MHSQREKLTIPNLHSIKLVECPETQRNLFSIAGMGIIASTFITPWGRYRYKVAHQGYKASRDDYTRRFNEIVSRIPDKTKSIDYTLV